MNDVTPKPIFADDESYDFFGVPAGSAFPEDDRPWLKPTPYKGGYVSYAEQAYPGGIALRGDDNYAITGLVEGKSVDPMGDAPCAALPFPKARPSEPERPVPDYVYMDFGGSGPGPSSK